MSPRHRRSARHRLHRLGTRLGRWWRWASDDAWSPVHERPGLVERRSRRRRAPVG